jgi:hypothetical protein
MDFENIYKITKNTEKLNKIIKNLKDKKIIDDDLISDTHHSFKELYDHRTILFSIICNEHPDIAFKTKKHEDETMFDDMFLAQIETPAGSYSYHCDNKFWDLFDIKELGHAPHWDGHNPDDVDRLFSLNKD